MHITILEIFIKIKEIINKLLNAIEKLWNIYLLIHLHLLIWEYAILRSKIIVRLSMHWQELKKFFQLIIIIYLNLTKVSWEIQLINSINKDRYGGKMALWQKNSKVIYKTMSQLLSNYTTIKVSNLWTIKKWWREKFCRLWDLCIKINFNLKI